MKRTDSRALLATCTKDNSEAAFRELVERYIDLVYSMAVRLAASIAGTALTTPAFGAGVSSTLVRILNL